jgi:hypothetical protein
MGIGGNDINCRKSGLTVEKSAYTKYPFLTFRKVCF